MNLWTWQRGLRKLECARVPALSTSRMVLMLCLQASQCIPQSGSFICLQVATIPQFLQLCCQLGDGTPMGFQTHASKSKAAKTAYFYSKSPSPHVTSSKYPSPCVTSPKHPSPYITSFRFPSPCIISCRCSLCYHQWAGSGTTTPRHP